MNKSMSYEEFSTYAAQANYVAVFTQMPADGLTPSQIYLQLQAMYQDEGVMLEDLHERGAQRYSFICYKPLATLSAENTNHQPKNQPIQQVREHLKNLIIKTRPDVAQLINKAVGFITYDAVRCHEDIPDRHQQQAALPLLAFNFYEISIAFDHKNKTILLSKLVDTSQVLSSAYQDAQHELEKIKHQLNTYLSSQQTPAIAPVATTVETDASDTEFMQMVEHAKAAIIRGDAFQIVISRRFSRAYSVAPFTIYQKLCERSPAPFMFYLPTTFGTIIGASPERFISVTDRTIQVNPIAGTRKRVKEKTNEMISAELLNDKKEVAEHMMLVDLARNDVGAVSKPGSVKVDELLAVKHYSHVSHITSTVSGHLDQAYDSFDAFFAAFPAGTLSGAPKIRAMELIDEIESSRRGLYGGAICRLDVLDNLDSCIAIRMALLQDGMATIRAGAGIVFDSDPQSEANETRHKAQSVLDAIALAQGE